MGKKHLSGKTCRRTGRRDRYNRNSFREILCTWQPVICSCDIRIIDSKDLFISQASLTGESEPIEKFPEVQGQQFRKGSVIELDNICYMGSNVISGAAKGIVFETGNKPI